MESAPGINRLLHYPEDPMVTHVPPRFSTGVSAPSTKSSFAAGGGTSEKGSLTAPSRTLMVVDSGSTPNPIKGVTSNTINVTRGDTTTNSLEGEMTWDLPSDHMRRQPPKYPPVVGPGGCKLGPQGTNGSMTEKKKTRTERRERERRE